MADRPATIEITADSRSLPAQLRRAYVEVSGFAAASARAVGKFAAPYAKQAGRSLLQKGRGLARGAFDTLSSEVVNAAVDVREFETRLVRLQQSGSASPATIDALRSSIRGVSKDTGVASDDLLAFTSAYLDLTGDMPGAAAQVQAAAQTWQATGADMKEVAGVFATFRDNLHVDPSDVLAAMSAVVSAGKAGSVSFAEMATLLPSMGAAMSKFKGGTGLGGVRDLGAVFQIINKDMKDAPRAATNFKALVTSLDRNAKKLKAIGVNVYDKNKKKRGMLEILDELSKKASSSKNPTLVLDVLNSAEAKAAFDAIAGSREELDKIKASSEDTSVINKDAAIWAQSSAGRIDKAFNALKETIAESFTPERIKAFAAALEKVVQGLVAVIEGIQKVASYLPATGAPVRNFLETNQQINRDREETNATYFAAAAEGRPITLEQAGERYQASVTDFWTRGAGVGTGKGGSTGDWAQTIADSVQRGVEQALAKTPPTVVASVGRDQVHHGAATAPANRRR